MLLNGDKCNNNSFLHRFNPTVYICHHIDYKIVVFMELYQKHCDLKSQYFNVIVETCTSYTNL